MTGGSGEKGEERKEKNRARADEAQERISNAEKEKIKGWWSTRTGGSRREETNRKK